MLHMFIVTWDSMDWNFCESSPMSRRRLLALTSSLSLIRKAAPTTTPAMSHARYLHSWWILEIKLAMEIIVIQSLINIENGYPISSVDSESNLKSRRSFSIQARKRWVFGPIFEDDIPVRQSPYFMNTWGVGHNQTVMVTIRIPGNTT